MSKDSKKNRTDVGKKDHKRVPLDETITVHVSNETTSEKTKNNFTSENKSVVNLTISPVQETSFSPIIEHSERKVASADINSVKAIEISEKSMDDKDESFVAEKDVKNEKKGKALTLTMEEFIYQAYKRKGQRVGLNSKQEKSLSANHKLDQDAFARLLELGRQDKLLQVPRQLLLVARNIQSHPFPKKILAEFVKAVMKQHPIFSNDLGKSALEENAALPSLYTLYQSIQSYRPSFKFTDEHIEGEDLGKLKNNALNLMTIWLFHVRNVRMDELVSTLFQIVWKPAAAKLETESQQIRALTELEEPDAIGWVADRYLKNTMEAQSAAERAHNEAVNFRAEANTLRESLQLERERSTSLEEQLRALKLLTEKTVGALEETNQVTRIHLSHDIELMRGRLIESLKRSITQLESGLSALNREFPLIQVMTERAEIVVQSLQSELKELEGKD